jgi:tRNA threonylcarbamoyladenosine modification (KEOPS) complex Cgi121 subunit
MATVMLTGVDQDTLERIKDSAATHGLTPAEYVSRLVHLHQAVKRAADAAATGRSAAAEMLVRSGLG